jgi:hypothetical protein
MFGMAAVISMLSVNAGAADLNAVKVVQDRAVMARTNMPGADRQDSFVTVDVDQGVHTRTNMPVHNGGEMVGVSQDKAVMERTNMGGMALKRAGRPQIAADGRQ